MTIVKDIMEENIVTIGHDRSALDGAKMIREKNVNFLVIIKNLKPIGILSDSDYVKKLVANNKLASNILITDIMSYGFRSVKPYTEIENAIQKMLNNNIKRLLVFEDGKLIGAITQIGLVSYLRNKLLIDSTIKNIESNKT